MTLDHQKVWKVMNDLEMVTSKVCSAREILDSAVDRLQKHQYDKVETLLYAVDEYLQYYLEEFDRKFKDAWKETVVKLNEVEQHSYLANDLLTKDRSSKFPGEVKDDCMPPWGHSDLEYMIANPPQYTEKELNEMCDAAEQQHNEPRSWHINVEEAYNKDGESIFSYIQLPDQIVEHLGLDETSYLRWIDNGDGTVTIKKHKHGTL